MNALNEIQKDLSKSKKKGAMKTTEESLDSAGKFGDPATAIESTKQALQARISDYKEISEKAKRLYLGENQNSLCLLFAST